jgi:hypothetical protein
MSKKEEARRGILADLCRFYGCFGSGDAAREMG